MQVSRFFSLLGLGVALSCASCTNNKPAAESCGCSSKMKMEDKEKAEAPEVKVKFADLPAAVKATLATEAPGVTITDADKEMKDGKAMYEADAMLAGTNYEIKVAEDGKLISKKIDDEASEKKDGGKDEKDEKSEKKD